MGDRTSQMIMAGIIVAITFCVVGGAMFHATEVAKLREAVSSQDLARREAEGKLDKVIRELSLAEEAASHRQAEAAERAHALDLKRREMEEMAVQLSESKRESEDRANALQALMEKVNRQSAAPQMIEDSSVAATLQAELQAARAELEAVSRSRRAGAEEMPVFPWPPPTASAKYLIPGPYFGPVARLSDIDRKLSNALDSAGYVEKSYFSVPGGFALATRLEQFEQDGSPRRDANRWVADYTPPRVFSLESYLKALFFRSPGRYRVIVFVVTGTPFRQNATVTRAQAMAWTSQGFNALPADVAEARINPEMRITALIYEFHQEDGGQAPIFVAPGRCPAENHMEKSQFLAFLRR